MRSLVAVALLCTCSSYVPPNHNPPDPPTFQKVAAISGGSRISWKNATDDDFDATLVARYDKGAALDGKPSGKTVPSPSTAFGSGLVVFAGPETAFTDQTLPEGCDTFTYQFWSHDKAGHFSGAGVIATTLPGGRPTPGLPPGNFAATRVGSFVQLSWSAGLDSATTKVVRTLGTPPVSADDGVQVFEGAGGSAVDPVSALPVGQTLFYAAYACNGCGACAAEPALQTMLIPRDDAGIPDAGPDDPDGGSPLQPGGVTATISSDGQRVELTWTNPPASTGFTQVKVLRTLNALPAGSDDPTAASIFVGLGTAASERVDKLLPSVAGSPRTYFYVVYGCANATCEQHGGRGTFQLTLPQALRAGGYTLWWRHATASVCQDSFNGSCTCANGTCTGCPGNNWWKSCDRNLTTCTARQLGDPSLTKPNLETTTIHDQFAMRHITIGRVLSSEYCRATQTADGFAFGPTMELSQDLTYYVYDESNRCANTFTLLNVPPAAGTNTAMISHAGFLSLCPPLAFLAWSAAAIFKPVPGGAPLHITSVNWDEWANFP